MVVLILHATSQNLTRRTVGSKPAEVRFHFVSEAGCCKGAGEAEVWEPFEEAVVSLASHRVRLP